MGVAIFFCHVPLATTGAAYHVTSHGNTRQDIVTGDQARTLLRGRLAHVIDRLSWRCYISSWVTAVLLAWSSRIERHDGAGLHLARRHSMRCLRGQATEATRPG